MGNYPCSKYKTDNSGKISFKYNYISNGSESTKITYLYDELGRIVKLTSNGLGLPVSCSYKYDLKNNLIETKTSLIFNARTVSTYKYVLENIVEEKVIHMDGNGTILYRNNGGYKHFTYENINNKNNNWISRIAYEVGSNINEKKKEEYYDRTFYYNDKVDLK